MVWNDASYDALMVPTMIVGEQWTIKEFEGGHVSWRTIQAITMYTMYISLFFPPYCAACCGLDIWPVRLTLGRHLGTYVDMMHARFHHPRWRNENFWRRPSVWTPIQVISMYIAIFIHLLSIFSPNKHRKVIRMVWNDASYDALMIPTMIVGEQWTIKEFEDIIYMSWYNHEYYILCPEEPFRLLQCK